jgi:hypothetical protein
LENDLSSVKEDLEKPPKKRKNLRRIKEENLDIVIT